MWFSETLDLYSLHRRTILFIVTYSGHASSTNTLAQHVWFILASLLLLPSIREKWTCISIVLCDFLVTLLLLLAGMVLCCQWEPFEVDVDQNTLKLQKALLSQYCPTFLINSGRGQPNLVRLLRWDPRAIYLCGCFLRNGQPAETPAPSSLMLMGHHQIQLNSSVWKPLTVRAASAPPDGVWFMGLSNFFQPTPDSTSEL